MALCISHQPVSSDFYLYLELMGGWEEGGWGEDGSTLLGLEGGGEGGQIQQLAILMHEQFKFRRDYTR